jgi:muconolactone delta-isomerase
MQFCFIARRRTESFSAEQFAALLDAEAERVRVLYAEGIVRAAWGRADAPGAMLLLEAENLEAANAALQTLPLVAQGMLETTLYPLVPYRGFAPRG